MKISEANRLRILYFLVFCCTAAWLPIMAGFLKDKGYGGVQSAVILMITPLMMLLVQPYYAVLVERFGYKKCLLISSFLASLSYLGYLAGNGFVWLIGITLVMSVFYNTIQPILDSLTLQLAQNNPKFSYGKLRFAGAAGYAITAIITGHLIEAVDTSVIFAVAAATMFLAFLFAIPLRINAVHATEDQSFKNVGGLLKNRTLLFLLICVSLISAGTSVIWFFYYVYMEQIGASASLTGYAISFQGICEIPFFYFSYLIIRRFGLKTTLLITLFVTTIRMLLYNAVKNPYFVFPIELTHGISWSLFWVVCVELVNSFVPEERRVTGQSLLYAAYYGAGYVAGNFWTGYLSDTKMPVSEILFLNAGIVFFVGLMILFFLKPKPTP